MKMPKMKFHISNEESEKRNLFYLWHIRHGSKKYVIIMSTPIAETSEKSIFAESSESGQTSSPQFVRFPFFRLGYLAMEFINCTIRSCSCSSSSKRKTCIKTFSVSPSAFASLAGDTFLNLSSENTISLAMAFPPFRSPDFILWDNCFYPWAQFLL